MSQPTPRGGRPGGSPGGSPGGWPWSWTQTKLGGAVVGLLGLALLAGTVSPSQSRELVTTAVEQVTGAPAASDIKPAADIPGIQASDYAIADIPPEYLAHYVQASETCDALEWQILAGIGKVESAHGQSSAPGVKSGVNRFGCCAGPMQFNLTNGPPSTWDSFKLPGDSVYDPADAVPAAARKLCNDGLAGDPGGRDPCPDVEGTPALKRALKRYNNACWYVRHVVVTAQQYTRSPGPSGGDDPFVRSLRENPRITTTDAVGCNPEPDLASGQLDLRVQSLLAAMAEEHEIRISCMQTGHSKHVKGTNRVSNHHVWRAFDINQIDGQPVSADSPSTRAMIEWLDRLDGPLRPREIGSPIDMGRRPFFTDRGHQGHIHIGYGAEPGL